MFDPLNYNHLHYFFEVARAGSITAAAKELRVSQPTISTQIRVLESALGVKLFDREGRGLVLTREGQLAQGYAEDIFRLGRELQRSLESHGTSPGMLRVGVADSLPKWLVSWLLEPVLSLRPRVRLVVREARLAELFGGLAQHEFELVLTDRKAPAGMGLTSQRVVDSPLVLFAKEPLAGHLRESLANPAIGGACPLVLPGEESVMRTQIESWFAERSIPIDIVAEVDDSALAKIVAASGVGCFAGPRLIADALSDHFGLLEVTELDGLREGVLAVLPRARAPHPLAQKLVASASERLAVRP